jgi:hypothetical protein
MKSIRIKKNQWESTGISRNQQKYESARINTTQKELRRINMKSMGTKKNQ